MTSQLYDSKLWGLGSISITVEKGGNIWLAIYLETQKVRDLRSYEFSSISASQGFMAMFLCISSNRSLVEPWTWREWVHYVLDKEGLNYGFHKAMADLLSYAQPLLQGQTSSRMYYITDLKCVITNVVFIWNDMQGSLDWETATVPKWIVLRKWLHVSLVGWFYIVVG